MTDFSLINEIDLKTASSNFAFHSKYDLTVKKDGLIGGFVTYFDAIFTKCHKRVILSTSPLKPVTHWSQTVFYFNEQLSVQTDDSIVGSFSLDQYKYNFRDLDITINVKYSGRYNGNYFISKFILR